MITISSLLPIGTAMRCDQSTVGRTAKAVAPEPANVSSMPNRLIGRAGVRRLSLPAQLLCGAVACLWATMAMAQWKTFDVEPAFVYTVSYGNGPYFQSTSFDAAWAAQQQNVAGFSNANYTVSASNPNPGTDPGFYDGTATLWFFDITTCYTNPVGCSTGHNITSFSTSYVCPISSGGPQYLNPPSTDEKIVCPISYQLPPKTCSACVKADPIYGATGLEVEGETDYAGASGLNFTRTYRSTSGFFASVLTQGFVDESTPAGTATAPCYPSSFVYFNYSGSYCFPYISSQPYAPPQYLLQVDDGRTIFFSGPNNAVIASGDINERVTLLTSGAAKWQVQREDDTVELYDMNGLLIQKTLRGGRNFTYSYSNSSTPANIAPSPGLLLSESDSFGHSLSWQYNSAGQMSQMIDPAGGVYQYIYDTQGNMINVVYPDGTGKSYWYNEPANTSGVSLPHALTGITDENAVRFTTVQYNPNGLAVNSQHAGGVDSYTFSYGASTTVTDPLGTTSNYTFQNGSSYVLDSSQTQPAASGTGSVTKSESYDANGNPATTTDYNGNVTIRVYDLTRNLEISRTEAYGTPQARTIATVWDANWRQPDLITEPNRTTAFTYDALGNVLTKAIADTTVSPNATRIWTYTYDSYGRMLTAKGPRTDVNSTTIYTYYTCTTGFQCGQVQTITDGLGHVTTFNTYSGYGQPLTITDPNGVVTTLTYDARLRVTSRQIGTETTSYAYYPTGLLKTVTLPDSSTINYTYDGAHRLTNITDGAGNSISYTLDNMGNRIAENSYDPSSTLHRTHTRVFNALNEISQDVNAAGTAAVTTTLAYDDNGNVLSSAAPLSRTTSDQYDALNRLTQITDPNNGF